MTTSTECRIHLVRHGTTPLNIHHRYRSRLQVPLDEQGWEDARRAATELSTAGLTTVYSSPLVRARDTASTIAAASGLNTVVDCEGLNNLEYGDWSALTSAEARALAPAAYEAYQAHAPGAGCPGGELLDDAAERIFAALRDIGRKHPGEDVAAVSHAAMVRLVIVSVTGGARDSWRRSLPNGAVTRVLFDGRRMRVPALEPAA